MNIHCIFRHFKQLRIRSDRKLLCDCRYDTVYKHFHSIFLTIPPGEYQEGYDHSYFFISSFIEDHITFHATRLFNQ